MAAKRCGISAVIIPKDNVRDLEEIDQTVRAALRFIAVEHVDQVFAEVLFPAPAREKPLEEDAEQPPEENILREEAAEGPRTEMPREEEIPPLSPSVRDGDGVVLTQ